MNTLTTLEHTETHPTDANARARYALEYAVPNNAAMEDSVFAAPAYMPRAAYAARAQLEVTAAGARIHARAERSQTIRAFFSTNTAR